jgi:hypothetical protein
MQRYLDSGSHRKLPIFFQILVFYACSTSTEQNKLTTKTERIASERKQASHKLRSRESSESKNGLPQQRQCSARLRRSETSIEKRPAPCLKKCTSRRKNSRTARRGLNLPKVIRLPSSPFYQFILEQRKRNDADDGLINDNESDAEAGSALKGRKKKKKARGSDDEAPAPSRFNPKHKSREVIDDDSSSDEDFNAKVFMPVFMFHLITIIIPGACSTASDAFLERGRRRKCGCEAKEGHAGELE